MDEKVNLINDQYVLSAVDGKNMMSLHENTILLDVRTELEFLSQHIPNSKLLPVTDLFDFIEEKYPNKDFIYIIYCRSGVRSEYARKIMKHLGYHHVYDMGGIIDWPYDKIEGFE